MNKKLLLGLGSTLILSVPILAATSCGDDGKANITGSQFIKDNTDSNKIIIKIDGSNLSTNQSDWAINESNGNSNTTSNVWTLDISKSNSSTVYFSANKNDTKNKTFSFSCNGIAIFGLSTPIAPTAISSKSNAFQGYQGDNQDIQMNDSNKANVSISSTESLAINFEFNKNASNSSQFMKMTLPPKLGSEFEGYQGYNGNTNIKWSLKENNNNFKIENNTLSSTSAIDPASTQNITLVGTISMGEWTDNFEIKVNFSKQASDIQISSVSTKVQNDKVIVTISGSKLPTESNKWKFKENNTDSKEWTLSTSPTASATQVTFEATYANVIGKTFTIEGTGSEGTTASKQFTVPVSTISAVTSEMTNDGNLILNVQGTNLSSTKSLYVFTFVSAAPLIKADDTATNPSIDTNQIQLTWTDDSNIKFTINKQGDNNTVLTQGLYGAKFSIGIKDQTAKTEFTFSDYVAPTSIDKAKFFTNVTEGATDANASSPLNINNITGSGLSYTITTSSGDNKYVRISLPKSDGSTNIFSFLSGQKGFTETGNNTTLTWSIPVDSATEWTYDEQTSELKNNTALDASTSKTIAITGTITDKITSRAKTFTLNLTLSLYVAPSITGEPTVAIVNDGEDKGKKIKVTFTGTGLSTNLSDWTISEKTATPPTPGTKTTPSWTIDPSSTANNVIFLVDFNKDTMGKTFTFSAQNVTGSKDVTIPTTTLTQVSSSIIDEAGNLILTFEGTNLSANLDIYDFNHKTTTTFADSNVTPPTPPTIDETFKNKINVEWKSAEQIVLTIQKVPGDGTKDALTKGLYGQTYEVNVTGNTNKSEFKFADYVAPTGVTNGIFGNSNYGPDNSNFSKPLDTNAFQGNNSLTWTITVPSSTDKWVQLNLKHSDFLQSLEGQKGFGQTNNETTKLSWTIKDNNSKFTYSDSEGLKNKEALTDTGLNVIMVGTLTDELTGVTKSFELNLTIKIQSASTTQNVTSATSNITDNGDLTISLTGTNLSQDPTKYQFTYVPENSSGKDENVTPPTVNSSMLEVDSTVTPSDTQVQFIIKKIKQGGSSYQLPTAQTKGLYGKTFSVTSVDSSSSNQISKAKQPVTFKFGSYIDPTGLNKQSFFKDVASSTQPISSGGEQQPNSFPISIDKITTPDTSKPFEYEISSEYKTLPYIYIDLPQANDILSSIEGQKGFSPSPTSSNPSSPVEEYTQVQWTLKTTKGKADAPQTNDNFELSNNLLHNKNTLTEGNSVIAELTATITDQLTSESVTFEVKLTFKLGTIEAPTITAPSGSDPKENITLNAGNESASGQNINIELTVKGSNLPKDISQWTITEDTTTPAPSGRVNKTTPVEVNNNFGNWTIKGESTDPNNPGIIFTTTWSLVAGKQLNFAVDGFESVKQKFTIPSPSFNTDAAQNKEDLNKGNIEFTIKGTDLSTDAGMYKFELLSSDSSTPSQAIDPAQYGITIAKANASQRQDANQGETTNTINSAIKVVIPKMIQQTIGDGTRYDVTNSIPSKISDFYGKNIKISIKNDTTKSVTCPVPGYSKPTQIQKGILGSISAGTTSDNLTQITSPSITPETSPATNQPQSGRYELNKATENLFEFTITLDKWESSYVQIGGIKDYNKPGANGRASNDDFLSYFAGLNGFTDSAHTSLTYAFKDTPQQPGSGQQSLIDQATTANDWTLSSNGLINNTAISDENGLSTTLVGTLTDLETNKTVTFDMKVIVKKPADLKPTISTPAPTPTLEENNTKVKVTITGTNLPTEFSKWTITEDNSPATPPTPGGNILAEGGDTSNSNIWSIDSSSTNTSVTFIANYKDVVAKKYKFALTDSSDISTTVTCPKPTYTGANAGFANNHYDIRITITGTNLPNDIEMYKFGKVTPTLKETTNSQEIDLNTLQKSIDFTNGSEVHIVFNKYNSSNSTLQTKGLYGKTSSFRFSNETEGTSYELTFPSYSLIGMKSAFLGTISTGNTHGNTQDSLSTSININDDSNNSYSSTITTNSSSAKYIKFELPKLTTNNNTNNGQQSKIRRDANQPDTTTFLTNWFNGYEGFTSSAHTSLTWAIDTTNTVNSAKWDLTDNVLTNKSGQEITVDGIPVLLTATIKDTETEEQVVCKIQLTVKLGADGSGSGNGGNAGGNAEGSTFVIGGKN